VFGARLTGGGFGGAVMALTKDGFTEKDATDIAQAYRAKHGRDPEMIHLQAADGAKIET
jgi:galactokinase